jgi:hypothetical protein
MSVQPKTKRRAFFTLMGLKARHRLKALYISLVKMSHFPCGQHSRPQTERFPARFLLVDMVVREASRGWLLMLTKQSNTCSPACTRTADDENNRQPHLSLNTHALATHPPITTAREATLCSQFPTLRPAPYPVLLHHPNSLNLDSKKQA